MRHVDRTDVLGQRTGIRDPGESQRTPEGATPLRQREAGRIGMHMCTPARQPAARIRLETKLDPNTDRGEPQQFGSRRAFATTDAGAHCSYSPCRMSALR
jgi:hypothetical protein